MKHRNRESMDRIVDFVNDWYREHRTTPSGRKIAAGTGISLATVQRMLNTMSENGTIDYDGTNIVTDYMLKFNGETVPVGIIGYIPCSNLSLEEDSIEEIVQMPVSLVGWGKLYMMYAKDDSMTDAGIDNGDLVLIRKQETAHDGDIVMAFIKGRGNILRCFRQDEHGAWLHPENPKYADIPLTKCKIQGVVISVTKAL